MPQSTPTQALRPNTHLRPRRLPVVCDQSRPIWDSRTSTPLSRFASSPSAAGSPNQCSVKTPAKLPSLSQRRRSTTKAAQHIYPFADSAEEDFVIAEFALACTPTAQRNTNTISEFRRARSDPGNVSGAYTVPARAPPSAASNFVFTDDDNDAVTGANFKARRHLRNECLAHPWGCDCEKVQLPTMGQNEAWQVMAIRYKAVQRYALCETQSTLFAPISNGANTTLERKESDALNPRTVVLAPLSSGADAPLKRRESDPVSNRANAPRVEEQRESVRRATRISAVLPRHLARRSTPAVLAVPTRVATKLKLHAAAHASRALNARAASRHGAARDVLPTGVPRS